LAGAFAPLRQALEIVIAHAGLRSNHRDSPYGPFGIRRIALCGAQAWNAKRKRGERDDLYFLWSIHLKCFLFGGCGFAGSPPTTPVAKRDRLSPTAGVSRIVIRRCEMCKKNHDVPATAWFEMPARTVREHERTKMPTLSMRAFRQFR